MHCRFEKKIKEMAENRLVLTLERDVFFESFLNVLKIYEDISSGYEEISSGTFKALKLVILDHCIVIARMIVE